MGNIIYINILLKNKKITTFEEFFHTFNNQQNLIQFKIVNKSYIREKQISLSDFYTNYVNPLKRKLDIPNLISITDIKTYSHSPEDPNDSVGTYFSNSVKMGIITLKNEKCFSFLKYEILKVSIQLLLSKYFEHSNEKCFFDQDTDIMNLKLCNFCHEQLLKNNFLEDKINSLFRILKIIKREYRGVQESNLFSIIILDIVGYSKYTDLKQKKLIELLQSIIKSNDMIDENQDNIMFLPTGDGCVITLQDLFYREAIRLCADLQKEMKEQKLEVRFGINFGSVFKYVDLNGNVNIAGSGINMAARVMDIGDANHIIANRTIYDTLCNVDQWHKCLFNDLGIVTVKHGVKLDVYNIFSKDENFGNPELPQRVKELNN
ncbi:MAG: hypothetical protein K8S23_16545 [Candidatus Cloacimonetes bacterium]|nr:hypothetical protein [Candidatus Cloacimonadota bacterium]